MFSGRRWIRTTEGKNQQIYSLPHLATLVFARTSFSNALQRYALFFNVQIYCDFFAKKMKQNVLARHSVLRLYNGGNLHIANLLFGQTCNFGYFFYGHA